MTRARLERQTALVQLQIARLKYAGKRCTLIIAALGLATAVVTSVTVLVAALLT